MEKELLETRCLSAEQAEEALRAMRFPEITVSLIGLNGFRSDRTEEVSPYER